MNIQEAIKNLNEGKSLIMETKDNGILRLVFDGKDIKIISNIAGEIDEPLFNNWTLRKDTSRYRAHYNCPECGICHPTEREAIDCCNSIYKEEGYLCNVCDKFWSDKESADACCYTVPRKYFCDNCGEEYDNEDDSIDCCIESNEEGGILKSPKFDVNGHEWSE